MESLHTCHSACTQVNVIDEGKPPACLHNLWGLDYPFPAWPEMCGCNSSILSPYCSPPTYLLHHDRGIFEVHEIDVAHKGKAEGSGREILWISVLHVVCDEQEDEDKDEECLQGDAVPEEVQHGWMVGLCRDVSHSTSGRLSSQGTTEAPRARGRWVMCWHSFGCKHKTARSGFFAACSLYSGSCCPSCQKGLNPFLIKLNRSPSSHLKKKLTINQNTPSFPFSLQLPLSTLLNPSAL